MVAWVRTFVSLSWEGTDSFVVQFSAILYDVVMGLTMSKHGGEHVWDITKPEARDALYVGFHFYLKGSKH